MFLYKAALSEANVKDTHQEKSTLKQKCSSYKKQEYGHLDSCTLNELFIKCSYPEAKFQKK